MAEQEKLIVRKNEIYWQVVDYEDYEECQSPDGKTKVYALFPFGSPYTRAYFMAQAVAEGAFYDGGYKEGHAGADWYSRSRSEEILGQLDPYGIYDYEVTRNTLRNIVNENSQDDAVRIAINFLEGNPGDYAQAYQKAVQKVTEELTEYALYSPIVSVAPGIVTKAGFNCYGGFSVTVKHSNDDASEVRTSYAHMKRWPKVQVGDIVGAGTILGYEGTTGNSGGNHLHMVINIGGAQSPSKYMGPIFSPFFYKEKALEVQGTFGDNLELILSSDYYSLERTVLMEKVLNTGEPYDVAEGIHTSIDRVIFLSSSFYELSGDTYVVFPNISRLLGDESHGFDGIVLSYRSEDKVIIKEGSASPVYWLCEIVEIPVETSRYADPYDPGSFTYGEYTYKVLSKTEIDFNPELISSGINIKVDKTSYETAPVVWGNNVPLYPIFDDIADAISFSTLTLQEKIYNPQKKDYTTAQTPTNSELNDVTADPRFFDRDNPELTEARYLPTNLLMQMSDVDNPHTIPFYDGPITEEMSSTNIPPEGHAGSFTNDLVKLKQSISDLNLYDGTINIDGVFDSEMTNVLSAIYPRVANQYSSSFQQGNLGDFNSLDDFNIRGVIGYNTYIMYGNVDTARTVGRTAAAYGAIHYGLDYSFVAGVANYESSFVPQNESMRFAEPADTLPIPAANKPVIEYEGELRVIRRAQGLMQLLYTTARGLCYSNGITETEDIVRALRSPLGNALLGSQLLYENIIRIRTEQEYIDIYNDILNSPNWKNNAKLDLDISVETLIEYGMSAVMYNKGPNATDIIKNVENIIITETSSDYYYVTYVGEEPGYAHKVIRYILNSR